MKRVELVHLSDGRISVNWDSYAVERANDVIARAHNCSPRMVERLSYLRSNINAFRMLDQRMYGKAVRLLEETYQSWEKLD